MKTLSFAALLFVTALTFAQKPIFVSAKVKAATVYYNAAELTQTATVFLPKGTSEIVVKNVADFLNENTIQIGAPTSVTVLSVQFSNNYDNEYEVDEHSPAFKKVKDSIKSVALQISKLENERNSEIKVIELLDKNQQVYGANSGLNVVELNKMVSYYREKRTEASNASEALKERIIKQNEVLANLKNKLELNIPKEDKTAKGKLILQVMNEVAGNVDLTVNYLTPTASWKPFYDLRASSVTQPIEMVYKAQVAQHSGLDWKKVKLNLSSGNPTQSNEAPVLEPWRLAYQSNTYSYGDKSAEDSPELITALTGKVSGLQVKPESKEKNRIVLRGNRAPIGNSTALVVIDNVISTAEILAQISPTSIKSVNVLKGTQGAALYGDEGANGVIVVVTKSGLSDYTSVSENQLNISFDIDVPYDILSNGKTHSVALKELKLPASFQFFAAPKIDQDAFLLAEIKDYAAYNLLPGEANIIFEGMYVGKTFINPGQTADTLSLSMGRDKKISIKREKIVDKSGIKFLSSKKEQTFTFDITVRNNKKETVELQLKDQYPISPDKETEIELLEASKAVVDSETGLLKWNLKLAPNETKKIRMSYKVKYPKDKTFSNL